MTNRILFLGVRFVVLLFPTAALMSGCMTRSEFETYTITTRDTTIIGKAMNAPGERENGVVYPSSQQRTIKHDLTDYDSTHERDYPAFLRLGLAEFGSFVGSGNPGNGFGGGMFGVYGLADTLMGWSGHNHVFMGQMFRLFPMEYRLRWFRDSPNWTYGWYGGEAFVPEADFNKSIIGVFPFYIRKRFFVRERIPYVMAQPYFGIGAFPWQYVNFGGSFDAGSLGGLNFHVYAGYIAGLRLIKFTSDDQYRYSAFPYFGFGVSALDFVNTVAETQREWKSYPQSSLEVSLANVAILHAFGGGRSIIDTALSFPTGIAFRFATVAYPLWHYGGDLDVGTSLFNLLVLSQDKGGASFLPLRLGLRTLALADELSNEAFVEANYYPSSFVNIGDKLSLCLERMTVNMVLGYASGTRNALVGNGWLTSANGFSGAYFGVGIGVGDAIFNLDQLKPW